MHVSHALNSMAAAAPPGPKSLPDVIAGLTGWVMGILALVATLFLVVGGLRLIAAGGNPASN